MDLLNKNRYICKNRKVGTRMFALRRVYGRIILMIFLLSGMMSPLHASPGDTLVYRSSKTVIYYDTLIVTMVQQPQKDQKQYTIQICTLSAPLTDPFFRGQYRIRQIRMGDLYRYIFSTYHSLQAARRDLPLVQKIYPGAFIREFDENKLGKAIDLKTDYLK